MATHQIPVPTLAEQEALLRKAFGDFVEVMLETARQVAVFGAELMRMMGFAPPEWPLLTPFERDLARAHNEHLTVMDRLNPAVIR